MEIIDDCQQYWFEIVNSYCQRFLPDFIGLRLSTSTVSDFSQTLSVWDCQQLLSAIIVSNINLETFGTNQTSALWVARDISYSK